MQVYPNPAKDQVRVEVSGIKPGNFSLSLMDAQGRMYSDRKVSIRMDETLSVDLSTVSNGLYFLVLRADNGQILRKAISVIK